jgi:uncharacterized protein YoxC
MNERILIGLSISSVVLLVLANLQLLKLMSSQADAAKTLREANDQLKKISGESSQTLQKVKDLQAIIDAGDQVSPELQSAIDDLKASIQSVDDLTPDITDGSGLPDSGPSSAMTGSDAQGVQKNVGPNGETGKKGSTAQL